MRPGIRKTEQHTENSYLAHTRGQSNGGRSLKAEHLAWYREELRKERETTD